MNRVQDLQTQLSQTTDPQLSAQLQQELNTARQTEQSLLNTIPRGNYSDGLAPAGTTNTMSGTKTGTNGGQGGLPVPEQQPIQLTLPGLEIGNGSTATATTSPVVRSNAAVTTPGSTDTSITTQGAQTTATDNSMASTSNSADTVTPITGQAATLEAPNVVVSTAKPTTVDTQLVGPSGSNTALGSDLTVGGNSGAIADTAAMVVAAPIGDGLQTAINSATDPQTLLMHLEQEHNNMLKFAGGDVQLASTSGEMYVGNSPSRFDAWYHHISLIQDDVNNMIAHGGNDSAALALLYARLANDPQAQQIAGQNCGNNSQCVAAQKQAWNTLYNQAQSQEITAETITYGNNPSAIAKPVGNTVVNTQTGQIDNILALVLKYRKNLPSGAADQTVSQVNQLKSQLAAWGVPASQITPGTLAAAMSTYQTRANATSMYSTTASTDTASFQYNPSQTWLQNYTNLQNKILNDTNNTINQGVRANVIGQQHGVGATSPTYGNTGDFAKGLQTSDAMRQADVQTQLLAGLQLSQQGDVNTYASQQGTAAAIAKLRSQGIDVQLSADGKSYTIHLKPGQNQSTVATVQKQFATTAQDTYTNTQTQFEQNYLAALQQLQPLPGETKAEYAQRVHDAAIGTTENGKSMSSFQPSGAYLKSNLDNNINGPDTVRTGDTQGLQHQIAASVAHATSNNNQLYTVDKGARDDPNAVGNVNATAVPTTAVPTTAVPTTAVPTTAVPTTAVPTTAAARALPASLTPRATTTSSTPSTRVPETTPTRSATPTPRATKQHPAVTTAVLRTAITAAAITAAARALPASLTPRATTTRTTPSTRVPETTPTRSATPTPRATKQHPAVTTAAKVLSSQPRSSRPPRRPARSSASSR